MDTDKAISWVESHWRDRPCPMCGGKTWGIQEDRLAFLGALQEDMETDLTADLTRATPVLVTWCTACGFIALIYAGITDVIH